MRERPRYLLDTEALVRAFRSDGPARELLQRGMVRDLSLLCSTTILDELDEVLARPKFGISGKDRGEIRRLLLLAADEVAIFDETEAPRYVPGDPGDDHVVEAALRTSAHVIVTMDPDFSELGGPFRVLADGPACEAFREGIPYGAAFLLSPGEQETQRRRLVTAREAGWSPRRAAYDPFRETTDDLHTEEVAPRVRASVLSASETAALATDLIRACGQGLLLDLRDGGSFDYLSGTRYDIPSSGAPPALDLIWYSSERAQAETVAHPQAPTIADFGWADEHRYRAVLAGGVLVVADGPGPEGEHDVRFLAPVGEPLASTPKIKNDFRLSYAGKDGSTLHVLSVDPAGFSSSSSVWLPGGACALLSPTALPRDALSVAFLTADTAAHRLGLPVPPPAILEADLPEELRGMIVRPGAEPHSGPPGTATDTSPSKI